MRSSAKVLRLPGAVRGIRVVRDVRPFGFGEEPIEQPAGDSQPPPAEESVESRLLAARGEGHAEGLREGIARGREEGLSSAREASGRLDRVIKRLGEERSNILSKAERDVVDLALGVAKRILRREVAVDRELVARVLRDALRRASPLEEVIVRINPVDFGHIKSVPGLEASLGEIRHFVLVEDRRVSVGGCLVETNSGAIDARVETQFEEIERALGRAAGGTDAGSDEG